MFKSRVFSLFRSFLVLFDTYIFEDYQKELFSSMRCVLWLEMSNLKSNENLYGTNSYFLFTQKLLFGDNGLGIFRIPKPYKAFIEIMLTAILLQRTRSQLTTPRMYEQLSVALLGKGHPR